MDVFRLHERLIADYANYARSFIRIADPKIRDAVDREVDAGLLWPDPLLQLNPNFQPGGTMSRLVADGVLHPDCDRIFRIRRDQDDLGAPMTLYRHQAEAIEVARQGHPYVLTTGTGSGKSLAYIVPIVDHILRRGSGRGIQAVVVYPMNALANSQQEELSKFVKWGFGDRPLVTFERYTGQESDEQRERILADPPDILLTNYVMLELILTRVFEQKLVRAARDTRFLVFDELHTYRGRQGADVAMLIRRCREAFGRDDLLCVGTSATMVSGDDLDTATRKRTVAQVATRIFGQDVGPDHVIGEHLQRSTPEIDLADPALRTALAAAVDAATTPDGFHALAADPLSSWIESTIGMQREVGSGHLIRQQPRQIDGEDGLAARLAADTGRSPETCSDALRRRLLAGSSTRHPETNVPLFAFRLHQFLTRGDTAWASIEPEDRREISLQGGELFKKGDDAVRMYPLCFCAHCGQAYYRVDRETGDSHAPLRPRYRFESTVSNDGTELESGYLYLSASNPWPEDPAEVLPRLPDDWIDTETGRVRTNRRDMVPRPLHVGPDGIERADGVSVAWISAPFRFCLNPECRVVYNFRQRSDAAKLSTLGVDGRSTATTVLSLATLLELRAMDGLDDEARKLLSFTDNRQDAALQTGHFNDFVEVAMVRSGLYHALLNAGDAGCTHEELKTRIFDALSLPLETYADPELRGPARRNAEATMRLVLEYFAYRDLKTGWRRTSPNLEQCGLLRIEYDGLDELAGDEKYWADKGAHPALLAASPDTRKRLVEVLLDHLRRHLAIKIDCLEKVGQEKLVSESNQRLRDLWAFETKQDLEFAGIAWPGSRPTQDTYPSDLFISAQSNYGGFLKRELGLDSMPDRTAVIDSLFKCLKPWGLLEEVGRRDDRVGYQIPAFAMIWKLGDGLRAMDDPLRITQASDLGAAANRYFIDFYRRFAPSAANFEAREHTAQVPAAIREDREHRFRGGDLSILFCSPTMELGIDISQLNVVNMRNVPPTPANYAQRSGRAGRPGRKSQPALVFTYCSSLSPHDQYYFRRQTEMVAGQVTTPRIDLGNHDLVLAHVHAVWLAEAGLDLGRTLTDILDVSETNLALPLKDRVRERLADPAIRGRALVKAREVLRRAGDVASTTWWRETWLDDVLQNLPRAFDQACDRWRQLYRAAVSQRRIQNGIIGDHSRPEPDRRAAKRLRAQAEAQITLLTDAKSAVEGDFNSYRYFASEGFLPGYNFPRLPVSAFIPGRRDSRGRDEFLSRPRFLAISEFGPGAIVYHEGAQYEINKVNLAIDEDGDGFSQSTIKICSSCGAGHLVTTDSDPAVCESCRSPLQATDSLDGLVRMQNVSARLRRRITSDEEERRRTGYEVQSTFQFERIDGQLDHLAAKAEDAGSLVASLQYGDAARIYRINLGWNRRARTSPDGFRLDIERGYWDRNTDLPDDELADDDSPALSSKVKRVVPFVEDRRNALVLRVAAGGDAATMASLQAALKEAIQQVYQLEPSELAADPLPSRENRRSIFFFEAAEGGAGVLRNLVNDPGALRRIARKALELCHMDPATGEDRPSPRTCTAACYDCLLDYGNQRDHQLLDRRLIRGLLLQLARSTVVLEGRRVRGGDLLQKLWDRCDSGLERQWLKMVEDHGFVPPSDGQRLIESCGTRPDFLYADHQVAIYIDGPPHDDPDAIVRDREVDATLRSAGYTPIRFHHAADWLPIFRAWGDVFGPGRNPA